MLMNDNYEWRYELGDGRIYREPTKFLGWGGISDRNLPNMGAHY